ncbi:hypothetical protein PIIN_11644 [Serendipita indica DSM 11827]|uniref:Uncharacterized protein n=1 Tax=Serendipita indica (strain DSM 11827) TaxID=1109443 RepID=G4U273_SERID|nr:hypothetical protein PIIN_11644 [Serendipita indica DSM 11827]
MRLVNAYRRICERIPMISSPFKEVWKRKGGKPNDHPTTKQCVPDFVAIRKSAIPSIPILSNTPTPPVQSKSAAESNQTDTATSSDQPDTLTTDVPWSQLEAVGEDYSEGKAIREYESQRSG